MLAGHSKPLCVVPACPTLACRALQLLPRLPGWEAVFRSVLEGFTRAFSSETAAFLGAALGRAVGVVAHVAAMMGGACVARALAERWGGQEAGWQGWAH